MLGKPDLKTLAVAAALSCALVTGAHAAMTISNAKTKNVSCTGGVCAPTTGNANLNTGELQTMLASSDVAVKSNAAAPEHRYSRPAQLGEQPSPDARRP